METSNTTGIDLSAPVADYMQCYVCPRCKIVFIKQQGSQVVKCPGCRIALTIPEDGDKISTIDVHKEGGRSMRVIPQGEVVKARRKEEFGSDEDLLELHEKNKLSSPLVTTIALLTMVAFSALVYFLVFSENKKNDGKVKRPSHTEATSEFHEINKFLDPDSQQEVESFLSKAFTSTTIDELLPFVSSESNVGKLRVKLEKYYATNKLKFKSIKELQPITRSTRISNLLVCEVMHDDFSVANYAIYYHDKAEDDQKLQLDWESMVGYSDIWADELLKEKPTQSKLVRVTASQKDFYAGQFSDESKWVSVLLTFKGQEEKAFYGYIPRGSGMLIEMFNFFNTRQRQVTLLVKYPDHIEDDGVSENQLLIEKVISPYWIY